MKYYLWTIGCQMNVADSRRLAAALEWLGYEPTAQAEDADVVVLNTCVVRQRAEDKVYGRVSSLKPLKSRRPETVIGVMGCLVGIREPDGLRERLPWVDVFMPPSEPGPLLELLAERGLVDEARVLALAAEMRRQRADGRLLLPARDREQLVSAYVPVVLGCSHGCAYCIIPSRRGPERSRPADEILAEVRALAAQGVREITLLGQIVDRYGYDFDSALGSASPDEPPLVNLLRRIHQVPGLVRIRFLTSHPNWMAEGLIRAVAELPKVCEHIEVPVQSGDDEILARMRRGYTVADYRALVGRIRHHIPDVSIATDIIVGFPGETDEQFQNTHDLMAELRPDKIHIARYSPRPQTLAQRHYPDVVPREEKERRRRALDELHGQISSELNARFLDQTVEVLVEGKRKGRWWGRTPTNRLVFFEDQRDRRADLAQVRVTWTGPWSLVGEPADLPSDS
jgi:tRNA-2-methylthio-N6-dimethylallyladenosine synthase